MSIKSENPELSVQVKQELTSQTTVINTENFKPGQKYLTPPPGDGDRVFYETLLQQRPESEMAQEWCLNYGVLPPQETVTLLKDYCKRKNKPLPADLATYKKKHNLK